MTWRATLTLLLGLLLSGCDTSPGVQQTQFYALGTEISVSLYGVTNEQANSTLSTLEQGFNSVDKTWHAWRPSVLTDINEAIANQQPIAVEPAVEALILQAQDYAASSQQLFNPAAGQLFELWGFHQDDWFSSRPPPDNAALTQWLLYSPDMTDIEINKGTLTSRNPRVKLGFGGFAKGYAINQAISQLQQLGIEHALVNIGGDLRAIGQVGERPWHVGIRHPRQDGMIATLAIEGDESVFTSGDYERFFEFEGRRYPHILDPRTGLPADQAISVTVLHHDAALADAAATAIFVAGDNWLDIATSMNVQHVMLVKPDGKVELSAAMQERVNLLDSSLAVTIKDLEQP